ncbi:hypothetical protein NLJ89_g11410 [Agrocybe chaxingu]|uniref:Uncharacterized protein n=1 Tax=Agrocybe chaxingu TaxID=84603 RepID=A0A9W8MR70_9AGAR|nr:hypothetical protein NLJ89_g11410 [Agrocybe chaxingu]
MTQYSSICEDTPEYLNLQPPTKAQSKSRIQVGSSSTQSQLGATRNRDIPVFGSVAKSWANRPLKQLRATHQRSSHFVVDKHDSRAPKDPPKVNEDLPTLEATHPHIPHAHRTTLEATSAVKEQEPAIDDLKPVDPPNVEPSSIQYESKQVLKGVPKSWARRPSKHNSSQRTPAQPEHYQRTSLEDLQPEAPGHNRNDACGEGASGHDYPFKGVVKSWAKRPLKQVSSHYPVEPTKCKSQPLREAHSTNEEQGILNARPEPQVRLEHESEAPKEVEQRSALLEPKLAETPPPTPPHKDPWAPPTPSRHPDVSDGVAFLEKSKQSDRQESKPRMLHSRPTYEKTTDPHRQNQAFEPSHRQIDSPRAPQLQRLHAQRSQPTLHSVKVNHEPSHIQSTHAHTHSSPLIQDLQAQLSRALSQLSDANETIQRLHRQSDAHDAHTSNLTASLKRCSEEISTRTTQNRVQVQKIADLETQLREVRAENRELVEEKRWLVQELEDVKTERATLEGLEAERDKWKEQLECMHLRMVRAEHRVRSLNLDPLLQDKFAARRESWIPARARPLFRGSPLGPRTRSCRHEHRASLRR